MFMYHITFGDGSKMRIHAASPKDANTKASAIGIVAHIKCLR